MNEFGWYHLIAVAVVQLLVCVWVVVVLNTLGKLKKGKIRVKAKVTVYKDSRGEWRWRMVADNGNIIADSGEGYVNKGDCINMVTKVGFYFVQGPQVEVLEEPHGSDSE